MAIVSVSEASRLAGKSRTTLQKYIKQGKLSKCTGENGIKGIDTSELMRVFGNIKIAIHGHALGAHNGHELAVENGSSVHIIEVENQALKKEIELLKELISEKDKRLLLLEHKELTKVKRKWWHFKN